MKYIIYLFPATLITVRNDYNEGGPFICAYALKFSYNEILIEIF